MSDASDDGPILFAYDGSEPAKASIREAGRQLRSGHEGIVLTIWQPLAAVPFIGTRPTPMDIEADIETEARRVADEGASLARASGFAVRALARSGDPVWSDIVGAADEHDARLVVLGSHGRSGIARAFMGSVAAAVARHTTRPVLIVHSP
jgi:nucleotide-binding universal stress UspA family protein